MLSFILQNVNGHICASLKWSNKRGGDGDEGGVQIFSYSFLELHVENMDGIFYGLWQIVGDCEGLMEDGEQLQKQYSI